MYQHPLFYMLVSWKLTAQHTSRITYLLHTILYFQVSCKPFSLHICPYAYTAMWSTWYYITAAYCWHNCFE